MVFDVAMLIPANYMHGFDAGDWDSGAAKIFEPEHEVRDPFDGPVVLFDNIVEALRLSLRYGRTGVNMDADDRCLVGAALVKSDFLWHVVQPNRRFEKRASCGLIALGAQQKIYGRTGLVHCTAQVL